MHKIITVKFLLPHHVLCASDTSIGDDPMEFQYNLWQEKIRVAGLSSALFA